MAIITDKFHILNALLTKNEENLYFALARTTEWDDPETPPVPESSQTELDELIYIKKISIKHVVSEYDVYGLYTNDVQVSGINWSYIPDDEVFDANAHYLYLSEVINFTDIAPTDITYRTVGILRNPRDIYGNLLEDAEYLGASIIDQGELLYIDNFSAISRSPDQSEKIEVILNL